MEKCSMEAESKQRSQRNRRRERAQLLQQEKQNQGPEGSGDEGDESPPRTSKEKGRPKPRRRRASSNSFDEDIIDGFAIISFKTLEDLESFQNAVNNSFNKKQLISPTPQQLVQQQLQALPKENFPGNDGHPETLSKERTTKLQTKKRSKRVLEDHVNNAFTKIENSHFKDVTPSSPEQPCSPRIRQIPVHEKECSTPPESSQGIDDDEDSSCPLEQSQTNGPPRSISGDRLSDASSHSSSGAAGYICDSESGDDRASDAGSDLFTVSHKRLSPLINNHLKGKATGKKICEEESCLPVTAIITTTSNTTTTATTTTTCGTSSSSTSCVTVTTTTAATASVSPTATVPIVANGPRPSSPLPSLPPPPPVIKSFSPQPKPPPIQPPPPPVPPAPREPPKRTPPLNRVPRREEPPTINKEKEPLPFPKTSVGWSSPSTNQLYTGPLSLSQSANLPLSLNSLHSHSATFAPHHHPAPPPLHTHHPPSAHPHNMFAPPLPPHPTLTSTALSVAGNVANHFGTDALSYPANTDYLPRDLSNRLIATHDRGTLGPASYLRTEMHQHQHQHMHQHQHTHQHTIGLPPFSPSLVPTPAPHLGTVALSSGQPRLFKFDKIPKYDPPFYRQSVPSLGYPGLPSLLTPAGPGPLSSGIPGAFQPKAINPSMSSAQALLSLREREKVVPPAISSQKKAGKWCAVHVRVAWEIYHHQQKQQQDAQKGSESKSDPLRPPSHLLPNSGLHRPPDIGNPQTLLGSTRNPFDTGPHHSSFLNASHLAVPPFARPSPYGFVAGSLFNGARDLPLSEWNNRLQKPPPSFPTPPPLAWPKADLVEREKEREREREREINSLHDRRKEEERERRNLERLNALEIDRGRDKDRVVERFREVEQRHRSRSRSRSPIRNGRIEPSKPDLLDKRHEDKSNIKIKEERRDEEVLLIDREKQLLRNDFFFGHIPQSSPMPVNILERSRMLGPHYLHPERPPQLPAVWNPFDKGFDMTHHRLELQREMERKREQMLTQFPNPFSTFMDRDRLKEEFYFRERERILDRLPIFERERLEFEQNKLPTLRPLDPLSAHFPRTVSPMVNHSSKSNSPASIPGAPPPLIPSSSAAHNHSHTNSPSSSKSKASSPLDSVSDLKDKRDSHSSSTDPDAHSR